MKIFSKKEFLSKSSSHQNSASTGSVWGSISAEGRERPAKGLPTSGGHSCSPPPPQSDPRASYDPPRGLSGLVPPSKLRLASESFRSSFPHAKDVASVSPDKLEAWMEALPLAQADV